ncbi:conserved hypothetical protein [Brochothrix thermosphacta]|nr:conserved hypothetical protein [Brochothrix thermosphacta]
MIVFLYLASEEAKFDMMNTCLVDRAIRSDDYKSPKMSLGCYLVFLFNIN